MDEKRMHTDVLEDVFATHSKKFSAFLESRGHAHLMAAGIADLLTDAMNDAAETGLGTYEDALKAAPGA